MKKISLDEFLRLRKLVHHNARPLDYTMWKYLFENGDAEDFLRVLGSYQNEDGGFGYNIECNNWNPNSSPYTICIALDYLDIVNELVSSTKNSIIRGIITYLASGAYMVESGWVGMQGISSNNEYAHMPWFHFVPEKAVEADIGVTKRLSDFVFKYADESSDIYKKAVYFKNKYKACEQTLVEGFPDYDPVTLNIKAFDPATWQSWLPLLVYFIGSPKSSFYPECIHTVDINLDTIVMGLLNTHEFLLASVEDLHVYEQSNLHPDGKLWCVGEQTIGNYYWNSHFITRDLNILRKFHRLDFDLPIHTL